MTLKLFSLGCLAAMAAAAGCASEPVHLAPVGPDQSAVALPAATGTLTVYTATQPIDVDFGQTFHPHQGYQIRDEAGHELRYVANHSSSIDETPDTVPLAPGRYVIVAESTRCGLVETPVVIAQGRATTVHLDANGWTPAASEDRIVRLPNGEAVGWRGAPQSP